MKKRILTLALALAMCLSFIPAAAMAAKSDIATGITKTANAFIVAADTMAQTAAEEAHAAYKANPSTTTALNVYFAERALGNDAEAYKYYDIYVALTLSDLHDRGYMDFTAEDFALKIMNVIAPIDGEYSIMYDNSSKYCAIGTYKAGEPFQTECPSGSELELTVNKQLTLTQYSLYDDAVRVITCTFPFEIGEFNWVYTYIARGDIIPPFNFAGRVYKAGNTLTIAVDDRYGETVHFNIYKNSTDSSKCYDFELQPAPRSSNYMTSLTEYNKITDSSGAVTYERDEFNIYISEESFDSYTEKWNATNSKPGDSTPSAWATAEVNAAISTGLVPEVLQQNYTSPVSRSNVAQMFINLIEQSSGKSIDAFMATKGVSINQSAFSDTTDKAVLAANALGIINGTGDGKFNPNGTLTRAQIAAIINRVANVLDVETEGFSHSFTDVSSHWSSAELGWPVHAGIINGVGDNKFVPDGELTTEQAIAITYRGLNALK